MKQLLIFLATFLLASCSSPNQKMEKNESPQTTEQEEVQEELDDGIRMIPIKTELGTFNVFTKTVGNNPDKRVLLLHGGPGGTHEFFKSFENFFPQENIEFIYYDQLGSYYSDQPSDTSLWTIERFVDEVEQVRVALRLDTSNFYLYGQSWGGILAAEYALKHQDKIKGLIISNMVMSIPEYTAYAHDVLGPAMPEGVFEEIMAIEAEEDFSNPRYMELLMNHHYAEHILRMTPGEWPADVDSAFAHMNPDVYVYMQGHSEFGITAGATLEGWDVTGRMKEIHVPTLSVGARYDSMDPEHMRWLATEVQNGRFLLCPNGSHLSQYDDQEHFFPGLVNFIRDVDAGEL